MARERMHWSMEVAAEKIGVSKTSIARWENGEQKPRGTSLDLVCTTYRMTAKELGLIDTEQESISNLSQPYQKISAINLENGLFITSLQEISERRSFLQTILHTACVVLFLPAAELHHNNAQEMVAFAVKRPSSIDNRVLDNLEIITQYYWNLRANITSSILLSSVIGHFQMLIKTMHSPHKSDIYKRLFSIAGETGQIIGQMLFDMKEYPVAWSYYVFSIQAAQHARNHELWAVGLGRMGQLLLYTGQLQEALSYVQEAKRLPVTNTKIRCWLVVVEAEIHAHMQQNISCLQNIDVVRCFEIAQQDEDHYSTGFTTARLESYIGVCYIHLNLPEQALVALERAFNLCDMSAIRRRSTILTDQSAAHVLLGNIDHACKLAGQALELTTETRSMHILDRIRAVQREMKQWTATLMVKELDERIKNTLTTITF